MTPHDIQTALAEPFPARHVDWKPQTTKGNRALAVAYIDARCVMDRLDTILGVGNWRDEDTCGRVVRLSCDTCFQPASRKRRN